MLLRAVGGRRGWASDPTKQGKAGRSIHQSSRARFVGAAVLLVVAIGCGDQDGPEEGIPFDLDLSPQSGPAMDRIGDGIGFLQRAIFLGEGSRVLVLDRHPPHLRLFTADGDLLWAGARDGEGPGEMAHVGFFGTSLADMGGRVLTLHRGRATLYAFEGDSLALQETARFPPLVVPSDVARGCQGEWIVYGRDEQGHAVPPLEERWFVAQVGETGFLHTVTFAPPSVELTTIWRDQPVAIGRSTAYMGRALSRHGERLVLHHRPMSGGAGDFLEFNCDGTPVRRTEEWALIRGDTLEVRIPRTTAPPAPTGAVAIEGGFVTIIRRNFSTLLHGMDEYQVHSEFMTVLDGRVASTALASGMWSIQDYHPSAGILMGNNDRIPHFIIVAPELLGAS